MGEGHILAANPYPGNASQCSILRWPTSRWAGVYAKAPPVDPPLLWLVSENRDEPVTHIELGGEDRIVGRVVWACQSFL